MARRRAAGLAERVRGRLRRAARRRPSPEDDERALPVFAARRLDRSTTEGDPVGRPTVVITGAAGIVGRVAARGLGGDFNVVGVDVVERPVGEPFDGWCRASVRDRARMFEAIAGADFVLHAATGADHGWEGLVGTEIEGTRNVLDAAAVAGVRRVVITSSHHVVGWAELERVGPPAGALGPTDPCRPDGLYAASKVFVEGLARAAAEYSGLAVSVLRIGTMALSDDPELLVGDPAFSHLGDTQAVRARMRRTWLYHPDFTRLLIEELAETETFRLRFATSSHDQDRWSLAVHGWTREPAMGRVSATSRGHGGGGADATVEGPRSAPEANGAVVVRDARVDDVASILAIYNDVLLTSAAIWRDEPETLTEREAWFGAKQAGGWPVLVAESDDQVLGFTSFGPFRDWPGYSPTVEHTIHIAAEHRGEGIGGVLLEALMDRARTMGKSVMVAGVDGANDASIRFHQRLGFREVARMPAIGRRLGDPVDLILLQREL